MYRTGRLLCALQIDRLQERALALLQKKARKAGCGAELICDEGTAATSCPYCGNPTVVPNVSFTY